MAGIFDSILGGIGRFAEDVSLGATGKPPNQVREEIEMLKQQRMMAEQQRALEQQKVMAAEFENMRTALNGVADPAQKMEMVRQYWPKMEAYMKAGGDIGKPLPPTPVEQANIDYGKGMLGTQQDAQARLEAQRKSEEQEKADMAADVAAMSKWGQDKQRYGDVRSLMESFESKANALSHQLGGGGFQSNVPMPTEPQMPTLKSKAASEEYLRGRGIGEQQNKTLSFAEAQSQVDSANSQLGDTKQGSYSVGFDSKRGGYYPKFVPAKTSQSATIDLARSALADELGRQPTSKEVDDYIQKQKIEAGKSRSEGYASARTTDLLDTYNNNAPVRMTITDFKNAQQEEPNRYIPATATTTKALGQTALIEDIRGSIQNTRDTLSKMKDFDAGQRAQIALVLKKQDPTSAISTFLASAIGTTLSPEQQDYLTDLAQLHEQAMAMRSVLGAGQGSEDLRAAIRATIPGASTPNKQMALKQLDKFEMVLNRLGRGIVGVPLRKPEGPTGQKSVQDILGELTADERAKYNSLSAIDKSEFNQVLQTGDINKIKIAIGRL